MTQHRELLSQDPLTERELEILSLIASGLTNREIAAELILALETVRWYTKRIYSKLQVRNRTEAAALARELDLLQPETGIRETQPDIDLPRYKLPGQVTAFIGRSRELEDMARLLGKPENRLLTILGPGGMGKSRLAVQIAKASLLAFPDGVFFVSMDHLSSEDSLPQVIAESLDLKLNSSANIERQLLAYLRAKNLLLVLDSFENMLPARTFVSDILTGAEKVKIIATSRERLDLRGETVYRLKGLELAASERASEISQAASVQLFEQTARQSSPDLSFSNEDLPHISRICHLVEGMPLGILLAAAWVDVLPPDVIADEITDTLDFLATDQQDIPARQRSIRAVFDHSLRQLSEPDRQVFLKLAVFRGGFTREAAKAVTAAGVRQLAAFSGKSLLQFDPVSRRYRLHALLRQYAGEEMASAGLFEEAHKTHMHYYGELLQRLEKGLRGRGQADSLDQIQADFQNIRAAWMRAVRSGQAAWIGQVLETVFWFCTMRDRIPDGQYLFQEARKRFHGSEEAALGSRLILRFEATGKEYRSQIETALESTETPRERAFLHWMLGVNDYTGREFLSAIRNLNESLTGFTSLQDSFYMVEVLHLLWMCHWFIGDSQAADAFYQQALVLARQAGNIFAEARALGSRGAFMLIAGRFGEADASTREALRLRREMGDLAGEAMSLAYLGWLAAIRGDLEEGRKITESAREISMSIHNTNAWGTAQNNLSWIASIAGDFALGKQLSEEAGKNPPDPTVRIGAELGLAFAFCGLEDEQRSSAHLKKILEFTQALDGQGIMLICLPVAALLLAHMGHVEKAAQFVGLALSFPDEANGWMQRWKLFIELQKELKETLGDRAYLHAREQGKRLSLAEAVSALLDEF